MAWFAQLVENNTVNQVIFAVDGIDADEMAKSYGGFWIETFESGNPRKHFAGVGYIYDESLDAFIPSKPYNSWVLNVNTYLWEAPIPYPTDGKNYRWDEQTQQWILFGV
jgi:hypothetical protein